jgi:NADH-quinone oxidoreductase subunit G
MTETKQDTITITVDGKEITCQPGELLIEVAKRAGIYIPYFCYHPRMDPVGACRMCLINLQPGPPKPQTACTTRVADGMVIETQFVNDEVRNAQQGVLEFLLINHPLDCPICDRGGECPLQDQTQDYGAAESRYVEVKRRFEKAVPISPLIRLDRERCILCYRCTRFCEELSGDTLIGVMERGSRAYIFPFEGEAFDSYFSGNTVQICPVGALTSSEYRFRARPWDIHNVASTCNLCSSGCSLNVGVRVQDGNVVRFSAAVNEDTNEEWLCDKGRYANAYISSPDRLSQPLVRRDDGELYAVAWNDAFEKLAEGLAPVLSGERQAGVIIGGSLCDEDAYVAQKFAREALGTNNVDHRLEPGMSADALVTPGLTYDDVLGADLVALVGCDVREELPVLFLRMRIAATKRGLRTAIVHPREIALSEYADVLVQPVPGTEASLEASDLEKITKALSDAQNAVVLLGPRLCSPDVVNTWRSVAESTGARFGWLPRRAGEYGALAAGAHPELLPGWKPAPKKGLDVPGMLRAAADGNLHALWLVGADVIADVPEAGLGATALEKVPFLVVQDVQWSPLLDHADVVLPGATFVERDGTLTDWEGRRQEVHAAVDPPGAARADYAILAETARRIGKPIGCRTIADIRKELNSALEDSTPAQTAPETKTNTITASLGGDLRLLTYRLLYDDGSRIRDTAGLRELTPGSFIELNPVDAERAGIADGQSVRVSSAHGSLTVHAQISKGIREGVAFVPWSQWGESAQALVKWDDLSPQITVEPA